MLSISLNLLANRSYKRLPIPPLKHYNEKLYQALSNNLSLCFLEQPSDSGLHMNCSDSSACSQMVDECDQPAH